jgi:hypothetical protein
VHQVQDAEIHHCTDGAHDGEFGEPFHLFGVVVNKVE